MVEYIVAIDVTRVRFPADAFCCYVGFPDAQFCEILDNNTYVNNDSFHSLNSIMFVAAAMDTVNSAIV